MARPRKRKAAALKRGTLLDGVTRVAPTYVGDPPQDGAANPVTAIPNARIGGKVTGNYAGYSTAIRFDSVFGTAIDADTAKDASGVSTINFGNNISGTKRFLFARVYNRLWIQAILASVPDALNAQNAYVKFFLGGAPVTGPMPLFCGVTQQYDSPAETKHSMIGAKANLYVVDFDEIELSYAAFGGDANMFTIAVAAKNPATFEYFE